MTRRPGIAEQQRAAAPADLPAARAERNLAAWSLAAALVLLAVMAGPFLAGRIYTRDDLGATHLPVRAFYAQQLARGEPFDWMPQIFTGFYLTGEGQAGTYHPWHLMLYRVLPLWAALDVEFLATYPLMLAGAYFWLRRLLRRRDAAMFGALALTFSGFNLLRFVHPNAVAVTANIPWLLWAIDIALRDPAGAKTASRKNSPLPLAGEGSGVRACCDGTRSRHGTDATTASHDSSPLPQAGEGSGVRACCSTIRACYRADAKTAWALAAVALLTGSQCLLGYPQYVWFSLLAETAYAGFLLTFPSGQPGLGSPGPCNPWYRLVIAKGCGLMLGGVQLLPTIDALSQSARRGAGAEFANWGSLDPLNLIQWIAPYLFAHRVLGENTHELGVYLGAVPLMLILWLGIRHRELGPLRRWTAALAVFGAVALLLAFGDFGQIYRLQRFLPLVGSFRFPCRYLVLFYLAINTLAAIGFVLLLQEHQSHRPGGDRLHTQAQGTPPVEQRRRQFGPLWIAVGLSVAVAAVGLVCYDRPLLGLPLGTPLGMLAGPVLMVAAAGLVVWAARGSRVALVGLIMLTAGDLGVYGLSYAVYPQTYPLDRYVAQTSLPPPGKPDGRVLLDLLRFDQQGRHFGNQATMAGWSEAGGYLGIEPAQRLDYGQLPALQVADVSWVRRGATTGRIEGLIPHDANWCRVPGPLPRARLVTQVRQSDEPARDISRIDVRSTALVEVPLKLPPGPPGTAEITADRPGNLHIRCNCQTSQLLVVSESFHRGWKARVDDRTRPVLRVDGDFLGCLVGPGEQEVMLEFRPESLRRGWIVSCFGLGLTVLCLVGWRRQPREQLDEDSR